MSAEKLAAHLRIDRYGDFWLTDAVRPSPERPVLPREGFRVETYRDPRNGLSVPVVAAAISREKLFDLFLELLDPLGDIVDTVLETSHDENETGEGISHRDLFREQIDLPVLKSCFCDFEDLLLHDGCTGVAVLSTTRPIEVQFDEHKLLLIYTHETAPFERILAAAGVHRDDEIRLITEGEHLHSTDRKKKDEFEQLCMRLGVGEAAERVNW